MASSEDGSMEPERMQYDNKCELLLTLVGYAVGLGNIWRFPYLTFTYGGGAFLIPYFLALFLLGLPLFILELGMGQMYRQGTLGVWNKMRLPKLKGVGVAATICTFFVSLYYNVILAWTVFYMFRTILAIPSGIIPWDDKADGFSCPQTILAPLASVANNADLIDNATGRYNQSYINDFWCPEHGIVTKATISEMPSGYTKMLITPSDCPGNAAAKFWNQDVLMRSSGLDDIGGFHFELLGCYTVAWLFVYLCVFKGVKSSGKVVYFTALLPYVALVAFFFRGITLNNAWNGLKFFLVPDFSALLHGDVWLRAVTQIFYSLGVGFGSLIAFGSYGEINYDFIGMATKVSLINCGTSVFAGFVVFPILGFLAAELEMLNPCINRDNLNDLTSVGLDGTGLAFVAFPIAIARMPGSFIWAFLFFLCLLCLGIDSQFAMVESIMTVLKDANVFMLNGEPFPLWVSSAIICGISYLLGLIFVTKAGIYWFTMFDYFTCIVAMFFVTGMECVGLIWADSCTGGEKSRLSTFKGKVLEYTGRNITNWTFLWKWLCPVLIGLLFVLDFQSYDIMGAKDSQRYCESPYSKLAVEECEKNPTDGTGHLPVWSILAGWFMGLLPIFAFAITYLCSTGSSEDDYDDSEDSETVSEDSEPGAE